MHTLIVKWLETVLYVDKKEDFDGKEKKGMEKILASWPK